jgi:hypothetical protein
MQSVFLTLHTPTEVVNHLWGMPQTRCWCAGQQITSSNSYSWREEKALALPSAQERLPSSPWQQILEAQPAQHEFQMYFTQTGVTALTKIWSPRDRKEGIMDLYKNIILFPSYSINFCNRSNIKRRQYYDREQVEKQKCSRLCLILSLYCIYKKKSNVITWFLEGNHMQPQTFDAVG